MKGILLCGGNGTRLRPLTSVMNKHLLPIFDRPMVLYPLETLKTLEIKDILLVSGGEYLGSFTEFLGDGSRFGVNLTYPIGNVAADSQPQFAVCRSRDQRCKKKSAVDGDPYKCAE